MTPELRAQLDTIDGWLQEGNENAGKLWEVLTALRGPDSGDMIVKNATTIHIRAAAFPRTAQNHTLPAKFAIAGDEPSLNESLAGGGHFASHVYFALRTLGIKETK